MVSLPTNLKYGRVTWHAVAAIADLTSDPDANPNAVAVSGSVTFRPSAPVLLSLGDDPVTVMATEVTYAIGPDGILRDAQGNDGVTLLATDSPNVTPTNWTWSASYNLEGGLSRGSIDFRLATDEVVDLTRKAPVASSLGVQIIQGPPGPPGSLWPLVIHGATASTARPATATPVIWFGSVSPTNIADGDVWVSVVSDS